MPEGTPINLLANLNISDERPEVYFAEQHAREPGGIERLRTDLQCQHYGKSLSIEHWEETCRACPGSGEGELIPAEEITRRLQVIKL